VEGQGIQNQGQHAPVMVAIGAAHQGMHMVPIGWTLRPILLHKRRKGGFAHDGIEDLVNNTARMVQRCFGEFEQQCGFPVHPLEVAEELLDDVFFGPH